MRKADGPIEPRVREGLVRIQERRSLGLVVFGAAVALMVVVVILFQPQNPMFLIVFPMLGTPVLLSAAGSECPRCAKPFFGPPIRVFFEASCAHCHLGTKDA